MRRRLRGALTNAIQKLKSLGDDLPRLVLRTKGEIAVSLTNPDYANVEIIKPAEEALVSLWRSLDQVIASAGKSITATEAELSRVSQQLREVHAGQEALYLSLQHLNQEAVKAFEARATAEKQSATVKTLQQQKVEAAAELKKRQEDRKALKAAFILTRDKVSELREGVANRLQSEAGAKVRIRVQRNADVLEYQQQLLNSLHGTKLKNQEDILRVLSAIRPEDLALMLREDDLVEFETHTAFGKERGRRILDALRQNLDPLELEVLPIDDRVIIELNVSTGATENLKRCLRTVTRTEMHRPPSNTSCP